MNDKYTQINVENKHVDKDTIDALNQSTIAYSESNSNVMQVRTTEWDLSSDVHFTTQLIKKIARTTQALFSIKTDKLDSRKRLHRTSLGSQLLAALKIDIDSIRRHFPTHKFEPHFELFARRAEAQNLLANPEIYDPINDREIECSAKTLNAFIETVRAECKTARFASSLNLFHRSSRKNYKEMQKYIKALFNEHARLLVLRKLCKSPAQCG